MMSENQKLPDPKRFEVSRATLWFDHFMGWAIRCGGISVIIAVFGIFYFIGKEVVPLFKPAAVAPAGRFTERLVPAVLGVDEWGEMPFFYDGSGKVVFGLANGARKELELPGLAGLSVTAMSFEPLHQRVALGLDDGRVGSFTVTYQRTALEIMPTLTEEPWFALATGAGPVTAVSYGDSGAGRVIVARRGTGATASTAVLRLGVKRGLVGKGKLSLLGETDITGDLTAEATLVRASPNGAMVLVSSANGEVDYFMADGEGVSKRQTFKPFGELPPQQMDFLFGGVAVVMTGADGQQQQWSLFRPDEAGERLFGETKTFPKLGDGAVIFAASQRNRTFLTGSGKDLSIRHSTSGDVRWQGQLDIAPVLAVLDAKGEHFIAAAGEARRYSIRDPHPEASWPAFFGKVWYEGGAKPVYQWQSAGGSDDFEPKLSLMPLIFGSLKGTAYALLFSVPIALLAALFSAAFLPHSVKRVVKPVMEIMSSLPSVVLGLFLLIFIKGAASFWPRRIDVMEVSQAGKSEKIAGYVIQETERRDAQGVHQEIQVFRGNKDLNGEAFVFIDRAAIQATTRPPSILLVERLEYGPAIVYPVALETPSGRTAAKANNFATTLDSLLQQGKSAHRKLLAIERKRLKKRFAVSSF